MAEVIRYGDLKKKWDEEDALAATPAPASGNNYDALFADDEPEAAPAAPAPAANYDDMFADEAPAEAVPEEVMAVDQAISNPQQGPMPDGEVTAPTNASLPEFRDDIYDGMDPEDAQALYDAYARHADTTDESLLGGVLGEELTYKGKLVRSPDEAKSEKRYQEFNKSYHEGNDAVTDIVKTGAANAVRNTVELGVAGTELAAETVTGTDLGWTEDFNKHFPGNKTKNAEDQWWSDAVAMVIGGVGGGAAMSATGLALKAGNAGKLVGPYTAKLAEWMVNAVGSGAGTAATYGEDKENLAAGPNAMLFGPQGLMRGINTDDTKTAENVVKKRLNVLIDGTALSLGFDHALGGAKIAARLVGDKFLKPIYGMFNQGTRESMIMDNLMKSVYSVTDSTTPKQMSKIKQEITDLLQDRDNFEALYDLEELGKIGYKRDTVTTLQRGYEKILANIGNDMSPEAMAEKERIGNILHRMMSVRKSVTPEGSKTSTALARPQIGVATALDEGVKQGEQYVDKAGEAVRTEANVQGSMAELPTELAQAEREGLDAATPALIADGKNKLGAAVKQSARPEDALFSREDALDKVVDDVTQSDAIANRMKNKNYDDIAATRGFEMNDTSWNKTIRQGINHYPEKIKKILDDHKGSYGETYAKLRGPLNDALNKLRDSKGGIKDIDAHDALLALKEELTVNQLDYMRNLGKNTGNTDVLDAVASIDYAEKFFKEEVAEKFRQGIPQKLKDVEQANKFNPSTKAVEQKKVLLKSLQSEHSDEIKQLYDLADTSPDMVRKGTSMDIFDIGMYDMAKEFASAVRQKGALKAAADLDAITEKYTQLIAQDSTQAAKIAKFKDMVLANRDSVKALDDQLKGPLKKQLDAAKEKIYEQTFKDFVDKGGAPKGTSWDSFKKLLNDPDAMADKGKIGRFDEIVDAVEKSGNPLLKKGIKAAWAKNVTDKLKLDGDVATEALRSTLRDNTPFLRQAEKLWGQDFADNFARVLNEVHNAEKGVRVKGIGTSEYGFGEKVVKSAMQKGINIQFGRLSRKGAQISSVMSAIIDQMDTAEMRNMVLQRVFENPDEFAKLLKKDSIFVDNSARHAMRQWLYGVTRAPEDSETNRQTEEMMQTIQ